MRFASVIAALVGAAAAAPATSFFHAAARADSPEGTSGEPGAVKDMIVSAETTINGTHTGPSIITPPGHSGSDTVPLPLSFVNNFGAPINAYIQGYNSNGAVIFIRADGSTVVPSSGGSSTPVAIDPKTISIPVATGQTLNLRIPGPIDAARMYFSVGNLQFGMVATPTGDGLVQPAPNNLHDPSVNVNWGFVELTVTPAGVIYANISYVDFVGLSLGMQLQDNNGPTQTARGLPHGAATNICNDLRAQAASDGRPWDKMCLVNNGKVVRVLSPIDYTSIDSTSFANYWQPYVDKVYSTYSRQPLLMETVFGELACRANGNTMTCDKDEIPYQKPTAEDIWGCNAGPFANKGSQVHKANLVILCAAFQRSTLLLNGGNKQPHLGASSYYTTNPTNHYSRIVHKYELDGKGYAFPYDDVNAGNENASGTVSSANPRSLLIWIGGN